MQHRGIVLAIILAKHKCCIGVIISWKEGQCKQDQKPPRDFFLSEKKCFGFSAFWGFQFLSWVCVVSVPLFYLFGFSLATQGRYSNHHISGSIIRVCVTPKEFAEPPTHISLFSLPFAPSGFCLRGEQKAPAFLSDIYYM